MSRIISLAVVAATLFGVLYAATPNATDRFVACVIDDLRARSDNTLNQEQLEQYEIMLRRLSDRISDTPNFAMPYTGSRGAEVIAQCAEIYL